MASIEQLQAAINSVDGATPKEVLDAFLPEKKEIAGRRLVPLTMGHSLFLSHCDHPLAKGDLENWRPHEVAIALYAFTNTADDLRREVEEGTLKKSIDDFTAELPLGGLLAYTAILMSHYLESVSTGLEMTNPDNGKIAQKKTLLGGFCQRLRGFVANITGGLTTLFTSFRSAKP